MKEKEEEPSPALFHWGNAASSDLLAAVSTPVEQNRRLAEHPRKINLQETFFTRDHSAHEWTAAQASFEQEPSESCEMDSLVSFLPSAVSLESLPSEMDTLPSQPASESEFEMESFHTETQTHIFTPRDMSAPVSTRKEEGVNTELEKSLQAELAAKDEDGHSS